MGGSETGCSTGWSRGNSLGKLRWEGARPDARRDAHFLSQLHCFTQHYTTLHYTTLHYIASNYITVHYIHTTQLVHTQLTHTYSSTHDLTILNQHQSVTISFLFPAFPLPSLGLSSQCCSRHARKNGLLCAVLLLGSLAHLVFWGAIPGFISTHCSSSGFFSFYIRGFPGHAVLTESKWRTISQGGFTMTGTHLFPGRGQHWVAPLCVVSLDEMLPSVISFHMA